MAANTEQQDKQCQLVLRNLLRLGFCSPEQVSDIWQSWHKHKNLNTHIPLSQFLLNKGIPAKHLQQAVRISQVVSATTQGRVTPPVTKGPPNEHAAREKEGEVVVQNNLLAKELLKERLLNPAVLEKTLQKCNSLKINLGQTLVRHHFISTQDLVRLMKQSSTPEASSENDTQNLFMESKQFGHYQIIEEIARGGMGVVYKASQSRLQRIVALKVLLSGPDAHPAELKRFYREVEATAGLNHPNIVPIYEMGEQNGYYFFTMKYIEGNTLDSLIEDESCPLEKKLTIFSQVCRALEHAHQNGILHRDLKPSNILLDKEQQPYLTDFGLAKFTDSKSSLTITGTALGTPFYMSPEQVRGDKRRIDHRSDIYSLGVILYQILTEQLPFYCESITSLYKKICQEEPIAPKQLSSCSATLSAICLKALAKEPEGRYQSAADLAKDITRFLEGKHTQASQVNLKASLRRWQRAYRSQFSGVIIAAASIVFIIFVTFVVMEQSKQQRIRESELKHLEQMKFFDAQNHYSQHQYSQALALLSPIVERNPNFVEALTLQGQIYLKLEKYPQALKVLGKAKEFAPQEIAVLKNLAKVYQQTEQPKRALAIFEQALAQDPKDPELYYLRSQTYQQLGKTSQARQDQNKAQTLENQLRQEQLAQIASKWQHNELGTALASLDSLISRSPHYAKAYALRAKIYQQQGEQSKALRDISLALEISGEMSYALQKIEWLIASKLYSQALESLNRALAYSPEHENEILLWQKKAEVFLATKEYHQAETAYLKLLELVPPNAQIHLGLAQVYFYLQKWQQAQEQLQRCQQAPGFSEQQGQALFYRGAILLQLEKHNQALTALQHSLEIAKEDKAQIHLLLAQTHFALKNYSLVAKHLDIAEKDLSQNLDFLRLQGDYYFTTEEYTKALEAYSTCIQQRPWVAYFYEQRGKCYSKLQKYIQSREDYFRALQLAPENFSPLLQIMNDGFHGVVILKVQELRDFINLFIRHNYRDLIPDLFQEEIKKVSIAHIQKSLANNSSQDNTEQANWQKQAQVLLEALTENSSPAIFEMVQAGLLAMSSQQGILQVLTQHQQLARQPRLQRQLQTIEQALQAKRIQEKKVTWRQLLVRYYEAGDEEALKKLYEERPESVQGMQSILEDPEEDRFIRFFAAQALRDFALAQSFAFLRQNCQSQDIHVRFLSQATLLQGGFEVPNPFAERNQVSDPLLRSLAVRYLPRAAKDYLEGCLQDPNFQVSLYAAKRLWQQGNSQASQVLRDHFDHPNPLARQFALAVFWDFSQIHKQKREKLQQQCQERFLSLLIKANQDPDPKVRQVAIIRSEQFHHELLIDALKQHLNTTHPQVRFQALVSLARSGYLESTFPVVFNENEKLIYRAAAFLGCYASEEKLTAHQAIKMLQLVRDKNFRLRVLLLLVLGEQGKEAAHHYLLGFLKEDDPYLQLGAVGGVFYRAQLAAEKHVVPLLQSPIAEIRSSASAVLTSVYLQHSSEKLQAHLNAIEGKPSLVEGAALAYAWPVYFKCFYNYNFRKNYVFKKLWDEKYLYMRFWDVIAHKLTHSQKEAKKIPLYASFLEKAATLQPEVSHYQMSSGLLHLFNNNYQKSIERIQVAIALREDFPVYFYWLAQAYFHNGQSQEALQAIDKFLQGHPWQEKGLILQEKILQDLGKHKQAKQVAERLSLIDTRQD